MLTLLLLACTPEVATEVPTDEPVPTPSDTGVPPETPVPTEPVETTPEPEVPSPLEDGFVLVDADVASFAGVQTASVGLKGDLIYAAVVNQTGRTQHRFRAGVILLDAAGDVVFEAEERCYAASGGDTVRNNATAHCIWPNPDGVWGDTAEVGFVDGEAPDDDEPFGEGEVVGSVTYGEAGTRFGYVEGSICRFDGVTSWVGSPRAIVLDGDGRPWDVAEGPVESTYPGECVDVLVGGLDMPADPTVVLVPF